MSAVVVTDDVYLVGGPDLTDPKDCAIYLLNVGELVLIDAGAGASYDAIVHNIEDLGFNAHDLSTLILTHCHIDHIGGAPRFREYLGSRLIMHHLDAAALERGDAEMTAAAWYKIDFPPTPVDRVLTAETERLTFRNQEIVCLHTPGHTPGSLSVYMDRGGQRILFGQDIHGPFYEEFGSDLVAWRGSMKKLLALEADVLCEGHFGIYEPKEQVSAYIKHYLQTYAEEDAQR
jgi:glyoxylase-like metal-dependent hydrolase (beta-lactamase superfamily II)